MCSPEISRYCAKNARSALPTQNARGFDAIADEFLAIPAVFRAIAADFGRNLIPDAIASDFGRNSGAIATRFACESSQTRESSQTDPFNDCRKTPAQLRCNSVKPPTSD